jgi:glutamate formiminotransferase/formiminotetrahydrofolate cyclodeaminase
MGTGLLIMVAGLPRTRGNTDDERAILAGVRERLVPLADALERCADRDTEAFNVVMAAYRKPRGTDEEKSARKLAIADAMRGATEAPLETLRLVVQALELGETVARHGNPSAASDARVAAGLLAAAAEGAAANVRINLESLGDEEYRRAASGEMEALLIQAGESQARVRASLD